MRIRCAGLGGRAATRFNSHDPREVPVDQDRIGKITLLVAHEPNPSDSIVCAAVATVIDGKQVAADVRRRVAEDASALRARTGHVAGLVTILVGEDPASQVYVRNKIRACEEAGLASFHEPMDASSTQEQTTASTASWCSRLCLRGSISSRCSSGSTPRRTWTASTR